jgi:HAD superfamily hydrolase (TIGR01509 family)
MEVERESRPTLTEEPTLPEPSDAFLAIFDHDGVLVDSLELHQEAWFELGRRTGLDFTPEFIHATFGMTNPSIFRRLKGDAISDEEIWRLSDLKEVCYRDVARGHIALMQGVRELLDALTARGVRLAIGSSGVRANLELTVAECGLDGRFAAIASLEDITRGKPDPQVFLVAADKAGAAPARSVVFEDAPVGIQAAKAAFPGGTCHPHTGQDPGRLSMYAVGVTTTRPAADLYQAGADEVVPNLVGYDVDRLLERLKSRSAR